MASDVQPAPFVKQLAANDRPTRDKAVSSLRTYLQGKQHFSDLELLKLWKGLFFSSNKGMWLSDRPRTQQRLATDLANLLSILPTTTFLPFISAFWTTIAREWTGIDVLRMDKILLLIRKYLSASFSYLSRNVWADTELVKGYMGILGSIPLNPRDGKVPNGLKYHVLDIYVEELDGVDTPRCGELPLRLLLGPLRTLEKESTTKAVRMRAKEALADERLKDWEHVGVREDGDGKSGGEDGEGAGNEWGGIDA
ncbi:MAG: hypothetical protein M1830_008927 [Pleopsidium flavum]|nr:MAG: hypothetical protein M1830_008927 [Pleopsidium flavum]